MIGALWLGGAACGVPSDDVGAGEPPSDAVADVDAGPPASGDQAAPAEPDADASSHEPSGASSAAAGDAVPEPEPPAPVEIPDEPPVFERPEHIRGIYLNAWTAGSSRRVGELLELARRTEINTFVIDIKDASGYVSHSSAVAAVRDVGATGELRIRDLPALLWRLHDAGIYPIARIVIVKDPVLIRARPELAVQDTAGGAWVDSKGFVWLNPYDRRVWEYHADLAEEVARLGFPEIQWDYVRFPDAPAADMARALFPGDTVGVRTEAIRGFLGYARERLAKLDVRMMADVFGVTTSYHNDVGIGQLWERFIDRVDAALPMVYPSHYWPGAYGFENPNAHPYEVVLHALDDATARSAAVPEAGAVVPWLQDFSLGEPDYGAPEVRAEIQATYDAGIEDWVLWNPGSHYTEAALEPTDGFRAEPRILVAGRVVPVSQRRVVLAQVEAARDSARAAAKAREAAADSARLARDSTVADTSRVRRRR